METSKAILRGLSGRILKKMGRDYTAIEKWTDDYNGAAIYSLVDPDGKRYVGQAVRLQNRLHTHRRALNRAYNGERFESNEGTALINAAKSHIKFRVEILEKIKPTMATVNYLREREYHYLMNYGGYDNTYNTSVIPVPNYNVEAFNDVKIYVELDTDFIDRFDSKETLDNYIKSLIRKDIGE